MFSKLKLYLKNSARQADWKTAAGLLKKINLPENARYLDIGCNSGERTAINAKQIGASFVNVYGMDSSQEALNQAKKFFNAVKVDIEQGRFPYPDNYFDLITISEVFEHLKNINFVFKEINRVLKKDGFLLISTPNLAALHNRILLLFGRQPLCLSLFVGTHIRGFTLSSWKKLLRIKGFQIIKKRGAGFHPLWGIFSRVAASFFPSFAVYLIVLAKKT